LKTRIGFISNSSSSSFIIAVKKSSPCKHCGRSDPDFIALLQIKDDYGDSDQTKIESTNIDEIVKDLKEWATGEDQSKLIKKILSYKDNSEYKIAKIQISYHDETFLTLFKNGISSGGIIELDRSE